MVDIEKKMADLSTLQKYMESLCYDLYSEMVKSWYAALKTEWGGLIKDADAGFYIKIKGMKIGCWLGKNTKLGPYWGIQTEDEREPSISMIENAELLLEKALMGREGTDCRRNGWIFYGYAKVCDVIFSRLAKAAMAMEAL